MGVLVGSAAVLAAAIAPLLTAVGQHTYEHRESHQFMPEHTLQLDLDLGHIEVVGGETDEITLDISRRVRADTPEDAEQIFAQQRLDVNRESGRLKLHVVVEPGLLQRSVVREVSATLHVPTHQHLKLFTRGGRIDVKHVTADIDLETRGGQLGLEHLEGVIRAETGGGHIAFESITGEATITTSGGHITGRAMEGDLVATTRGGHVRIDDIVGTVAARTNGGNMRATFAKLPGGPCSLETNAGSIDLQLPERGPVSIDAETGAGTIVVSGVKQRGHAFSIARDGVGEEVRLRTGAGNITISP